MYVSYLLPLYINYTDKCCRLSSLNLHPLQTLLKSCDAKFGDMISVWSVIQTIPGALT